jgi:hypothetical protein
MKISKVSEPLKALPKSGVDRNACQYIQLNIRSFDEVFVNRPCNICGGSTLTLGGVSPTGTDELFDVSAENPRGVIMTIAGFRFEPENESGCRMARFLIPLRQLACRHETPEWSAIRKLTVVGKEKRVFRTYPEYAGFGIAGRLAKEYLTVAIVCTVINVRTPQANTPQKEFMLSA